MCSRVSSAFNNIPIYSSKIIKYYFSNFSKNRSNPSRYLPEDGENKFLLFVEKEFLNYKVNIKKNDEEFENKKFCRGS